MVFTADQNAATQVSHTEGSATSCDPLFTVARGAGLGRGKGCQGGDVVFVGVVCLRRTSGGECREVGFAGIVEVESRAVGREEEGLRTENVQDRRLVDVVGRAEDLVSRRRLDCDALSTHGSRGTAILVTTLPVTLSAPLTMPSVPALKRVDPSRL